MDCADTIAAVATAPGRGGIAVVRVSGPDAFAVAERLSGRRPMPRTAVLADIRVDRCVMLTFAGPASYTGEDTVEFQCHGGTVTPRRVLEACFAAGARLARRGEFTERALLNGKIDYDQAESVLDLVDARTDRAADSALAGLDGRKARRLRGLYETALALSAELEHALDVDEGELPADFGVNVGERIASLRDEVAAALRGLREGRILREGAVVVLAGEPNAGKSSLMNALLETNRAIVSDVPGTTRDSIEEWLDIEGWPVRLVDTAGLRRTDDAVEAEGVRRSEELIARADVVLALDCDRPRGIRIHSKCDLGRGEGLNVSAKTGEGLDELRTAIAAAVERGWGAGDGADGTDGSRAADALTAALELLEAATADEPVLAANAMRNVCETLGAAIGAVYSDDLLDRLFSHFCVGK